MSKGRRKITPTIEPEILDKQEGLITLLTADKPKERVVVTPPAPATNGKVTKRITIDIPLDFHAELKSYTKANGQTIKGYLLMLARQNLNNRSF